MSPHQHGAAAGDAPRPLADLQDAPGRIPGEAGLSESRCADCGARAFPPRRICVACLGTDLAATPLPTAGTLYSFSTVHVSSARETPYVLGYVDLPDGVRVLTEVVGDGELACDLPVELVTEPDRWYFTAASTARDTEDR